MKSDYIERESCRNFFGILDRFDYFSATSREQADLMWDRNERFFTRDILTTVINYVLELETDRKRYTELERVVMGMPNAREIFTSCKVIPRPLCAKNGKLIQGDILSKDELSARRKPFR